MMWLSYAIDKLSFYTGRLSFLSVFLLALLVFYDASMRYLFSEGSIALQELEWHLFDLIFLLGFSYTLKEDKHVRVDIFFEKFTQETQHLIHIFSMILLVIPFSLFFIENSYAMVTQSYIQQEISSNPGGLSHRWIIKAFLLLSFTLILLQAFSEIIQSLQKLSSYRRLFYYGSLITLLLGATYIAWYHHMAFLLDPILLLFLLTLTLLLLGFPVAFVFAGTALFFTLIADEISLDTLQMLPYRTYGIMTNQTLMAIPLFIFMGLILEKSKMAEGLLMSMGKLFGSIRGGLAISVVLVGAILAASTGIVGASVVMMSLIALPLMLKQGYSHTLATGSIAASGTLGQLIPPSIVLIVLGDQMHLSVGDLFRAAVVPGVLLIALYILYILIFAYFSPKSAPAIPTQEAYSKILKDALKEMFPPLLLITVVLGSIFAGIASPSESAAIGVFGAILLASMNGVLSTSLLTYATKETTKLTSMIFMILIGATAFSLVFNELGGGEIALAFFSQHIESPSHFILLTMFVIFLLGFFIDFIEIAFVVVPILVPIVAHFGIDPIWFALLIAMNLQASFLTPPFGFALFYLKGAAPKEVSTYAIYKGVLPFIFLQLIALGILIYFPELIYLFQEK